MKGEILRMCTHKRRKEGGKNQAAPAGEHEIHRERKNKELTSFKIVISFFVFSPAKGAWDSVEFWSKIAGFPLQKIQEKAQERQECLGFLGFPGT